ncbi:MAG TPA: ABC transporter permease [Methylophaga aminisulfidivorans]|jgi:UDP-glucose/iron transport system permease protein|uniref:ABC transporter permease n=1 Tax=Methylophaga TaxID=40222 RepID=UPI0017587067|nr:MULTISPECIES: ABC transporter permease [Methylophaga]HIC45899.1 ABC transporter permease [Methylophaga sp.]HIM39735.1 ABC transporter permease [Methylophaga aminisulfidivorans]
MNTSVQVISNFQLTLAFIPVVVVLLMMLHWSLKAGFAVYALIRMLIQLLLVGYVLTTVFAAEQSWVVMLVMFIMVSTASWIALGTVQAQRRQLYPLAFVSILLGGGLTLMLVTQSVIGLTPWFEPRYMIPLAGMIFANAMNSISLAAERLSAELARNIDYLSARNEAFQAAFIPTINSMLAVGLVSLPGMMTGQILSGVSPITAAHYQIVVMCMIFGGSGLSIILFLWLAKARFS